MDRNKGNRCPYCSGKRVLKGKNDLQTLNPLLTEEWDYEKNKELTPVAVMPNSDKKVWWKCKKGHEWQAVIKSRSKGHRCPYCSGRYAVKGETDLQAVNPMLASEWHYEKNKDITPMDVLPNSNKKVWWICSKGHEWQSIINNRSKGRGCPYCSKRKK